MTLILTSVHEAALNAVAEVPVDLGVKRFTVSLYSDDSRGSLTCYVHGDVETSTGDASISVSGSTIVEAARDFVEKANHAIANPQERPLRKPSEVKDAAAKIIDDIRTACVNAPDPLTLDELSDKIAALPVSE